MARIAIATGIGHLVASSNHISDTLQAFHDRVGSGAGEYNAFAREINNFVSAWSIAQPRLQSTQVLLLDCCLHTLNRFLRDTGRIIGELRGSVNVFTEEYLDARDAVKRHRIRQWMASSKRSENSGLKRFMRNPEIVLQRSQLHHATTLLNVILAVIDHANARSDRLDTMYSANHEIFLFNEEFQARRKVERRQLAATTSIRSSEWARDIPTASLGGRGRFDRLTAIWVQRAQNNAETTQQDHHDLRAYVDRLNDDHQQRHQELQVQLEHIEQQRVQDQVRIQQLQNEIEGLTATLATYESRVAELRHQCEKYRDERDEVRQNYTDLHNRVDRSAGRAATTLRNERNEAQSRAQALERELATLQSSRQAGSTTLQTERDVARTQIGNLERELAGLRSAERQAHSTFRSERNTARTRAAALEQDLQSLSLTHNETLARERRYRDQRNSQCKRRRELEQEVRDMSAAEEQLRAQVNALELEKNHLRRRLNPRSFRPPNAYTFSERDGIPAATRGRRGSGGSSSTYVDSRESSWGSRRSKRSSGGLVGDLLDLI